MPRQPHRRRRPGAAGPLWALLALLAAPAAADLAASEGSTFAWLANTGRTAGRNLERYGPDSIDPFNGGLSVQLPLGIAYPLSEHLSLALSLRYGSQAWDFETTGAGLAGPTVAAWPAAGNAGFGWDLGLGRLVAPGGPGNPTARWLFVAPDGRRHLFYDTLAPGLSHLPGSLYSRDGAHLRLDSSPDGRRTVRYPDGRALRFAADGGRFRLERYGDHRGAWVDSVLSADGLTWRLVDLHGRQQTVRFEPDPAGGSEPLIDRVELVAFGGGVAVYDLHHTTATIPRPASDTDPETPPVSTISLLTAVDLPDGTRYELDYDDDGLLAGLRLPTLGRIEWRYQAWQFPRLDCVDGDAPYLTTVPGIAARRMVDRSGGVLGEWTFAPALDVPIPATGSCEQPRELAVAITDPAGHRTISYFSVYVSGADDGLGWNVAEYGQPFTRFRQDTTGLLLSTEVHEAGDTFLSHRVAYEGDPVPDCDGPCIERSWRATVQRTTFHDDTDRWIETVHTGHDGYAFTGVIERSDFPGELATVTELVHRHDPDSWLLAGVEEERRSRGAEVLRLRRCLDARGDVVRNRVLAGPDDGPADLVTVYQRDALGNVVDKRLFGGDTQPAIGKGDDLCAVALPAEAAYRQRFTVVAGVVAGNAWVTREGTDALILADRDLDPATGLIAAERDSAGLETRYQHDALGRRVRTDAPDGSTIEVLYTPASGSEPALETTLHRDSQGTSLTAERIERDDFGRVSATLTPDRDGDWVGSRRVHDALGRLVEETDAMGKATRWLDFDPLARPRVERPPSGATNDRTFSYRGVREVTETWRGGLYFAAGDGSLVEGAQWVRRTYDSRGLPTGSVDSDGDHATTVYDLAGHAVSQSSSSPVDPEGVLWRQRFDGRGFLVEVTAADGTTRSLAGYDALGKLTRTSGEHGTVDRTFDAAGRLVEETDDGGRTLRRFEYATGNGPGDWRRGKLRRALRFNHDMVDVDGPLVLAETRFYEAPGGRLSRLRLVVSDDGGAKQTFWSAATWDALGQVASYDYPHCNGGWRLDCPSRQRTVHHRHRAANRRLLERVESTFQGGPAETWAGAIRFFDDGSLESLHFGGGPLVYQVATPHPDLPRRPLSTAICTVGSCQHFSPLVHDGEGRLVRVVSGPHWPDDERWLPTGVPDPPTLRPTRAELADAVAGGPPPACPQATYDALGKLTSIDRCAGGPVPRYLYHAYDAWDRLTWTVGSADGTTHLPWTSHWRLYDLEGRVVREHRRATGSKSWILDSIFAGSLLVGRVEGWSAIATEGVRWYVHNDHRGAPFSKHRVEDGQVVDWSRW